MRSESRLQRIAALLWLLAIVAIGVHQWRFWQQSRLDANVLALLPQAEQEPLLQAANARLAALGEGRVVVLVGAVDFAKARVAAEAAAAVLGRDATLLRRVDDAVGASAALVSALAPWRDRLLTSAQRSQLAGAGIEDWSARVLADLYQPFAAPRLLPFARDALSLWPQWWAERAGAAQARPRDGVLALAGEGRQWVLLEFESTRSAFAVSGAMPVSDVVAAARTAAQTQVADAELLAAGVPLHAEAAAAQASFEVNTIGWGSLAAVLLLVWLTFRSLRPIALVAVSLLVGCAAALSVTAWCFGQVHLLTLVFGASLVGVAEDYGFHWFAARQGQPQLPRQALSRQLLPGLALALATSAVAYLALGLAPFPGLRQMAVFSATGLTAAFLTVVCLFPLLDRRAPTRTRFADACAASLAHWPRWRANRTGWSIAALGLLFVIAGCWRLQTNDDLRQLHAAPPDLVAMQERIGQLLGLPSPAQFFLVEGDDVEQVLQREEALVAALDAHRALGDLAGYQALSQWLPSAARQADNARLSAAVETTVIASVAAATGDALQRADFASEPLRLADLRALAQGERLARTWLGSVDGRSGSIVLLHGVRAGAMPALAASGGTIAGVRFVDRTAGISELLGRYRVGMGAWLAAGYLGVFLLLSLRHGRSAWRALLPTLAGTLLTLAVFGLAGWPLQLFGVLALLLLLGMGVDYGIFLLEHPGDGAAWLAVALAGVSTLLAFGLLALSATPALRAFGLTMLIGEVLVWLLTPCFRPEDAVPTSVTP